MSDEALAQKLTGRKDGTPEQAQEMVNALVEAASLAESQNQALQEELRKYQPGQGEGWPDDRHEFAGRLTALREVAEALQERAEKAEAALREIEAGPYNGFEQCRAIARAALSPTQETDPIRCQSRCDQYPNCQHDWRSWHTRPTQETDPG